MKNNPLLSVIVPIFRVEKYLNRCVDSIINQTYKELDIILVDDGSPDGCPELCDLWATKDERIRVIHKKNAGLGFARNSGLEIAKGEFVAFIDSDDYIDLNMYENLMLKAEALQADIVYCGHHFELPDGSFYDVLDFEEETVFEKDSLLELSLLYFSNTKRNPLTMSVWHSVYRKEVIKTMFFSEREVVSEDLHFQMSAILNANRVVYLPKAYYYYCYNNASLSHTFIFEKFYRFIVLSNYLFDLFKKYERQDIAYHYLFYTTLEMLRQIISNPQIDANIKKNYISQIASNKVWCEGLSYLDVHAIPKHLKLLYYLLKRASSKGLYYFSLFDYYVVCKKLNLK